MCYKTQNKQYNIMKQEENMETVSMMALIEAEKTLDIIDNHLINLRYDDLEEFQDRLRKTFQRCANELWRRDPEIHQR